jgi:ABC-type oligopeptide transport system ATPase subunit
VSDEHDSLPPPDGTHHHGVRPHDAAAHAEVESAAAAHVAAHDAASPAPPAHPAHVHAPGPATEQVPADAPEILRLEGLEVHFPIRSGLLDTLTGRSKGVVRAVDGIDLSIRKGEILALVGESGSGKTTTGRVVVKLTKQTGGTMAVHGRDVSALWGTRQLRDYRRRVQLIFQDPYETLNPKHTIAEFVMEPLIVNKIGTKQERRNRTLAALESAGLRPATEYAHRYPHELSGGQRQRVVIAGALVMDPELVVADEPVSMLDVSIRTELLRLMLDLRRERGLTYLFITHDLSIAWVIADRVGETPDAAHVPSGCRFHPRCPLAFARCKVEEPPLFDVGDGHQAACWLAEAGPLDLPVIDAVEASGGSEAAAAEVGVAIEPAAS